MGRNSIPKLGEWRDGKMYRFRSSPGGLGVYCADNGEMIVYEVLTPDPKGGESKVDVLATCYADGLQEVMAAMFEAGLRKGKRMGREDALGDVRRVLGLRDTAESG